MADKANGDAKPIRIKKYANRRLYNTAKSSYVTLDDLAEMVREGHDFHVNDAKTGEDITRSVLTQIIFEAESKGQKMLPTNFLRQLIRLYGDALQGVVPSYLDAAMETFSRNQEQMRDQLTAAFGANPALANLEALTRRNMEWFENALRAFTPFAANTRREMDAAAAAGSKDPAKHPQAASPDAAAGNRADIDALRDQLVEMQSQLERLTRK